MNDGLVKTGLYRTETNPRADVVSQLYQALGLLTTLKPDMEIDINDPIGMAQQIVEYIQSGGES